MIEWLWQQSLTLTLLIGGLLAFKALLHRNLGSVGYYQLWILIPLYLFMSIIPANDYVAEAQQVKALTIPLQNASHAATKAVVNYGEPLLTLWALGACTFFCIVFFQHRRFILSLNLKPHNRDKKDFSVLQILETDLAVSPFITGLFNTKLILPQNFSSTYDNQQQNLVIEHEYCHYHRGDLWWNSLALALLGVFWFNPFCFLAYREFRQAQEWACDQTVLKDASKQQRIAYGNAMLLNAYNWRSFINPSVNFGDKKMILKRLKNIKTDNSKSLFRTITVSIAILFSTLFGYSVIAGEGHQAKPIVRIKPVYPVEAATGKQQGYVDVRFTIDGNGRTRDIVVTDSNPQGVFDSVATNALKKWRYQPTGEQIPDQTVRMDFVLDAESGSDFDGKTEIIRIKK